MAAGLAGTCRVPEWAADRCCASAPHDAIARNTRTRTTIGRRRIGTGRADTSWGMGEIGSERTWDTGTLDTASSGIRAGARLVPEVPARSLSSRGMQEAGKSYIASGESVKKVPGGLHMK